MKSSNSSDNENSQIKKKQKKHLKSKKRKRSSKKSEKRYKNDDSASVSSNSSSENERYKRKKEKLHSSHRSKHDKKKKKKAYSSDDDSSFSSSDVERDRKRKSKHKSSNKESSSSSISSEVKYFVKALHYLLDNYPDMTSQLPFMLYKMVSDGTTFNLSSMKDTGAAKALEKVFDSLRKYGVICKDSSWGYQNPFQNYSTKIDGFVLIKLAATFLDQAGITSKAVFNFESISKDPKEDSSSSGKQDLKSLIFNEVPYDKKLFAKELMQICAILSSGDVISFENIQDSSLKPLLANLFHFIGLESVEMEDSNDSTHSFGYGLPQKTSIKKAYSDAKSRLQQIINTSKSILLSNNTQESSNVASASQQYMESSEDEECFGPLLPGAKPRQITQLQMTQLKSLPQIKSNAREEWMMTPGEHDLLQELKKSTLKSRTFQNKRSKKQSEPEEEFDFKVQSEINSLIQASHEARGATLMEQHLSKKKERELHKNTGKWNWNRDKDLDAGRRVDKDALKMVFGGAKDGLKDKFQSSFSR